MSQLKLCRYGKIVSEDRLKLCQYVLTFSFFIDQTSWTTSFASLLESCLCDPARLPEYFPCGQVRQWVCVCAQMYISSWPPPSSDTLSHFRTLSRAHPDSKIIEARGSWELECRRDGSGRFPRFRATERPPNYSISEKRFLFITLFAILPEIILASESSSPLTFNFNHLIFS